MAVYSIKDLERISGIKAHTLRIWEKRYGLLQPKRTETNIRYYLDEDLQHLLKVVFLNRNGLKVSKIAELSKDDLVTKVEELMDIKEGLDGQHDALTLSVLQLDRFKVERILNHKIDELGLEECLFQVIYPLLEKINLLWITASFEQYHENFLIQIIRQKLFREIDLLSAPSEHDTPRVLLFSNKGDGQDLTLLLCDYYLRKSGYNSVNLGSGISKKDLTTLHTGYGSPEYILLMLNNSTSEESVLDYLDKLCLAFPESKIWVSGYLLLQEGLDERIVVLNDVLQLQQFAQDELQMRRANL